MSPRTPKAANRKSSRDGLVDRCLAGFVRIRGAPAPVTPLHGNRFCRSGLDGQKSRTFLLPPVAAQGDLPKPESGGIGKVAETLGQGRLGIVVVRQLKVETLGCCDDR